MASALTNTLFTSDNLKKRNFNSKMAILQRTNLKNGKSKLCETDQNGNLKLSLVRALIMLK